VNFIRAQLQNEKKNKKKLFRNYWVALFSSCVTKINMHHQTINVVIMCFISAEPLFMCLQKGFFFFLGNIKRTTSDLLPDNWPITSVPIKTHFPCVFVCLFFCLF
jgi:hypothetical protein